MKAIKGKHLLSLKDYTPDEIKYIINTARSIKSGEIKPSLKNKNLAMIFQKPSTRTRVSFEVAMTQLGGHAIYLNWNDIQLGRGESIPDTARTLSRYVDVIMARVFMHKDIELLAGYSQIPVINGLSNLYHPCQILGDILTILEKKGRISGLKLAFVGDGNNVCNSLLIGASKLGLNITVACPEGYEPPEFVVKSAKSYSAASGAEVKVTNNPKDAVKDADIIYTDVWVSMGQESEYEARVKAFKEFRVDEKLVSLAKADYIFMHCLPRTQLEVSDAVFESEHSVVWEQAENRLHAQKAILLALLG
ncbi:MAG: ornithine carbamoyltransferase [Candidatus Odinarchaeia archaeon]